MNKRSLLVIVLVIGLLAVGYWGYSEYLSFQRTKNELNNRYENAFQGVNNHIDALESELGTILISNSPDNLSVNLSNIWRTAYSAQEDIGQLPISSNSLNNTKDLLQNVLQYTNYLDKKVVDGGLKEKDKKIMNSFYKQVCTANKSLETIHDKMSRKQFKWYDQKRVKMDQNDKEYSASPLGGLEELDNSLNMKDINKELKEILPDKIAVISKKDVISSLSELKGKNINESKAIKIARKFVNNPEGYEFEAINNNQVKGKGDKEVKTAMPAYSVKATKKNKDSNIVYIDVAKRGGRILWLLNQRGTSSRKISYEEAEKRAMEFLKENGYNDMKVTSSKPFNGMMLVSLAPVQNNVVIKPDCVTVQVALDNGEVIGFNGIDYTLHHRDRPMKELEPRLTEAEARKKVSENLKLQKEPRLILERFGTREVLCYEFVGKIGEDKGEDSYKIKINADTGAEETVKSIEGDFYKNVE